MIDFDQSGAAFENDADVQTMFDTMEALDIPHEEQPWQLCPVDQARAHMQEHMVPYMEGMGGQMGGSNADDDSGASSDTGGLGFRREYDASGSGRSHVIPRKL